MKQTSACLALVCAVVAGCANPGDLSSELEARRKTLQELEVDLTRAARDLPNNRDLIAELKYRPISKWLSEITSPGYTIHGIGTVRDGDLVYSGGIGKAWIEPERDTWFDLSIRDLRLSGSPNGLTVDGSLDAYLEMRVRLQVLNVGTNVLCNGRVGHTAISLSLAISQVVDNSVPYELSLSAPSDISVPVECGLGRLGTFRQSFAVNNLAQTLARGRLGLGFASKGMLAMPPEIGGAYKYLLVARNPEAKTSADRIIYASDVDVSVSKTD